MRGNLVRAELVSLCLLCNTAAAGSPPTGTLAWFPLDDGGASTADSVSGLSALLSSDDGSAGPQYALGDLGTTDFPALVCNSDALIFDGTDDYISIEDSDALPLDGWGEMTLAAWVRMDDLAAGGAIISKYDSATDTPSFVLYALHDGRSAGDAELCVLQSGPYVCVATTTQPLSEGSWTHLAAVWSGGTDIRFYADGVEVPSEQTYGSGSPTATADSDTPVELGAVHSYGGSTVGRGSFLPGALDEVLIADVALDAADILGLVELASCDESTCGDQYVQADEDCDEGWDASDVCSQECTGCGGELAEGEPLATLEGLGEGPVDSLVMDYNGDGEDDLVIWGTAAGKGEDTSLTLAGPITCEEDEDTLVDLMIIVAATSDIVAADIDNDGNDDFVVVTTTGTGVTVLAYGSTGDPIPGIDIVVELADGGQTTLDDLDDDGIPELITASMTADTLTLEAWSISTGEQVGESVQLATSDLGFGSTHPPYDTIEELSPCLFLNDGIVSVTLSGTDPAGDDVLGTLLMGFEPFPFGTNGEVHLETVLTAPDIESGGTTVTSNGADGEDLSLEMVTWITTPSTNMATGGAVNLHLAAASSGAEGVLDLPQAGVEIPMPAGVAGLAMVWMDIDEDGVRDLLLISSGAEGGAIYRASDLEALAEGATTYEPPEETGGDTGGDDTGGDEGAGEDDGGGDDGADDGGEAGGDGGGGEVETSSGCGCASSGSAGGLAGSWALLAALLIRRRGSRAQSRRTISSRT